MRYVIFRDDDTNALTPVDCLERLYRPFLDRGLPVNLATIPDVSVDATQADGRPEGFLMAGDQSQINAEVGTARPQTVQGRSKSRGDEPSPPFREFPLASNGFSPKETKPNETLKPTNRSARYATSGKERTIPIGENGKLVNYLKANPDYHILQHGCHHNYLEFDCPTRNEVVTRLENGTRLLREAGFPKPETFVAPYDKLSRTGLREVAARFRVLSTGWFELRRLPYVWWPQYAVKKLRHAPHWKVGRTLLLSHPGCLLSCHRTYSTMLAGIIHYLNTQPLTVLVTHWWEYFRDGHEDTEFVDFLHETASYVATHPQIKVISFSELATTGLPRN